ncbi:MAG: insulinase family protein, partial [Desulfovibrionaceae bacterium]|nr:insulinase family protein [Desulfovibrionaceae bacterium]
IGFRKSVEKLSAADIHAYVDEKYQPQSMLLTVVGKVDPEAVLAEAERLLGGLSNTRPVRPPEPILDLPAGPMVKTVKGKWNKVYLGLAFPVPGLRSGKVAGLETLAQLLGGDETSRLYRTFKYEKRLVDDISAMSMHLERSGLFYIQASLDQDKVEMFWRELMIELSGLDPRDFSSREMERAKLNLEDSLFLAKETLSGLASKLGYFQFFEQGPASEQNYLLALSGVDRDELAGLYAQYIRPDNLSACLLVPDRAGITGDGLRRVLHEVWPTRDRAAAGAASPAGMARRIVDLPGGGRLVLIPDQTLPYTALSLFWPGGDGRLDPGSQGLAELASRVLLRGTRTMSANQIEDFLSDRAANVAANAGRDVFSMDAKFPSRFSAEILPLISQMLTDPAWAAKEIDRAKQDQVAAIKRREDQPLGLAFRHIFPFLFRTGPYSYFHDGQPEQVLEFSKQDITGFWSKQSKAPFVLAACGRFDEKVLSEFAAGLAQTLAGPGEAYEFASPRWAGERQTELKLPDRNQAHVLVVFPASGKEDKAASARLSLLRAILAGQSGLLFRDLRDRQGLGYTVTAFLWQAPKTGFMALYIGTEPSKIERSMEGFKKALEKVLEEDLPGQEIDRAKNILLGEYSQEHQTLLSRSREAAALMAWGLDIGLEREIVDLAQTLEAEDLRQEARRVLDWDRAYVMKVTP